MATLSDLCYIQSGFSFRAAIGDAESDVRAVQLRDVDWGTGTADWSGARSVDSRGIRSGHFLREGDVLFSAKGHINRALLVPAVDGTVAASTFFVLRADQTHLLPGYLAWLLNSPHGQKHARRCLSGSSMPSISKRCLERIPIPLPPLATQERIAEVDRLVREERLLSERLQDLRARRADAICLLSTHQLS